MHSACVMRAFNPRCAMPVASTRTHGHALMRSNWDINTHQNCTGGQSGEV